MTVEELLAGINESGPAMAVLRSRLEGTAGAGLDLMSAAEIGEEFGVDGHGSFARVEGGNDLLARQLARDLDLRFQKIVTSIHSSSTGVEVVVRNHVFPADAVVLAVPLGVLKRLVFEPDLSPEVSGALDALQMGVAVKTAVATEGEPGLFRRQDTDVPAWYWTGLRRDGSVRSAITGFAGSKPGVQALLGNVGERLARAAPDDRLDGEPVVVDWGSDVFAGGCYSVIGPGQRRLLEVLARPWGRVFLAGEHVNGSGTIEGAILSGEDAVSRLLASGVC
jgi:monoamine oxidase